jgi:hypothetical protein
MGELYLDGAIESLVMRVENVLGSGIDFVTVRLDDLVGNFDFQQIVQHSCFLLDK